MRKLVFTITAVVAMVACSKNELLQSNTAQAIVFDNAIVESYTRASDNSNCTIDQFQVYGTISNANGTVNIFGGDVVERGTDANNQAVWVTAENKIQYWIPGNTYNFAAVANNQENATEVVVDSYGMPSAIKVLDASQQKDILLATAEPVEFTSESIPGAVAFRFAHLMSKVKFAVRNATSADNGYTYEVKNIRIENATKSATYTIGSGWNEASDSYVLSFVGDASVKSGDAWSSADEHLLIPTQSVVGKVTPITVKFDCTTYDGDELVSAEVDKTIETGVNMKPGFAYNFTIVLDKSDDSTHSSANLRNNPDVLVQVRAVDLN